MYVTAYFTVLLVDSIFIDIIRVKKDGSICTSAFWALLLSSFLANASSCERRDRPIKLALSFGTHDLGTLGIHSLFLSELDASKARYLYQIAA